MSDKKKFTIKAFRPFTQMDRTQANQIWALISRAIDEIQSRDSSHLSFEELYRNAYKLVLHKHGTVLYDGVTNKITSHLLTLTKHLASTPDATLLEATVKCWFEHRINMIMIRDILMYMDRTYVPAQRKRPVYELGLHLFRITVWENPSVQPRVTSLLLDSITNERNGIVHSTNSDLKEVVSMLLELGHADGSNVYERDFEQLFLGTTQEFYRCESLSYLSHNSASDYVRKAEMRLEEEKLRASKCVAPSTDGPLLRIIETELVERHAKALVEMDNCGFKALLGQDESTQIENLQIMYDLFSRVSSTVDLLRDALSEIVKREGKKLVTDQERASSDPAAFVRGVLAVRKRYNHVVQVAFRGEKRAEKRLKEAFEDFLNADARAASCLAVYVDELLRTGLRGVTEAEVEARLQNVIIIFRYLSDKDVFEAFYKQHLAKRLLGGKSISDEAERSMVSLLKAECGYQFTSKLEGMFNDMRISRDTRDAYKQYKKIYSNTNKDFFDLEVDVLTTGYWPSQPVPPCTLPPEVNHAIDRFSTFYLQKHTGRKLSWQTSTGTVELRAMFESRKHELCVSTYQMCILMLFNKSDVFTLSQIRVETNIPDQELRRHLISLCTPKHRILKKASRGKAIASDNDSFTFNKDYTSKLKRVKIPLVSMKETQLDSYLSNSKKSDIPAPVEEDRRHLIEAAIVRIMKARKSLNHNCLVAEVSRQLSVRFAPTPQFIKKRIESLIEREYLERDVNDRRLYIYMA